jgi:hypothetical protein
MGRTATLLVIVTALKQEQHVVHHPFSHVVSAAFRFRNASRSKFLSSGSVMTV